MICALFFGAIAYLIERIAPLIFSPIGATIMQTVSGGTHSARFYNWLGIGRCPPGFTFRYFHGHDSHPVSISSFWIGATLSVLATAKWCGSCFWYHKKEFALASADVPLGNEISVVTEPKRCRSLVHQ